MNKKGGPSRTDLRSIPWWCGKRHALLLNSTSTRSHAFENPSGKDYSSHHRCCGTSNIDICCPSSEDNSQEINDGDFLISMPMYVEGGTIEVRRHMSHTTKFAHQVGHQVYWRELGSFDNPEISGDMINGSQRIHNFNAWGSSRLCCRPASIDNSSNHPPLGPGPQL